MTRAADAIIFLGMLALVGAGMSVLRWHGSRLKLRPGREAKALSAEEVARFEWIEQDAADALTTFVVLAGVLFVIGAAVRFWPW